MQLPWLFSLLAPLLYFVTVIDAAPERNRNKPSYSSNLRENKQSNKAKNKSSKPNIILIMTDDQDLMLGSMDAMNKTRHILGEGGATFNNAFVTTPMCCPSRSTILTGLHTHNHNVYTNNEHCGSLSWRRGPETKTFATFLKDNTYRTGYFGKYLNTYNGTYIPPGWMEWVGLVHNSRFYNYTINRNGKKIRMKNDYYKDYLTDLIANDSVTFFKLSKQVYPTRPVAIVLSMPAPHGPEDAAPQYQHMFSGVMTHRTPTWNIAPNHDKHWIFQYTTKMEPQQIAFTDILQQKRLQTLLSVDDAVEKSYNMLKEMDELDNTFIIFTSDHGYHAGQFGLVKGKSMPYDFDIRVPFYIRGPNIPPGIQIPNIILNVDIAPTILDMAGIPIPQEMDGKSVLKLLFNGTRGRSGDKKKRQWRDTFLVERGKPIEERERSNYLPRNERMKEECAKPEYQSPCQPEQLKECVMNEDGTLRFKKCRNEKKSRKKRKKCRCNNSSRKLGKKEKKSQRLFIREHISQDDYKPRFMRSRNVRDTEADLDDPFSFQLPDNKALSDGSVRNAVVDPKCQIYPNRTVMCDNMVSSSKEAWNEHSQFVSMQIKELREKIKDLKDIHNYLRKAKPPKRKYCICKSGDLELDEEDLEESDEDDDDSSIVESATVYSTGEKKNRKENLSETDKMAVLDKYIERLHKKFDLSEEEIDQRVQKKAKKLKKAGKKITDVELKEEEDACQKPGLNCFYHHNNHWKTPPLWTLGSFCFCPSAVNNTYWCLRTINTTHNFLYCEFVTGFLEFFDMKEDPHQRTNIIHSLTDKVRRELKNALNSLKGCKGPKDCNPKPELEYQDSENVEDVREHGNIESSLWNGWQG